MVPPDELLALLAHDSVLKAFFSRNKVVATIDEVGRRRSWHENAMQNRRQGCTKCQAMRTLVAIAVQLVSVGILMEKDFSNIF